MEPDRIADCPYKPGTEEHKVWIRSQVINNQLDRTTIAWNDAKQIADDRLLKLSAQHNTVAVVKSLALEQLIASMPVSQYNTPILSKERLLSVALISEVNKIWEATWQGIEHRFMHEVIYLPQIQDAPDWATKKQLLRVLYNSACVDYKEMERSNGWMRFALHKPFNFNASVDDAIASLSYGEVRVQYKAYRLPD